MGARAAGFVEIYRIRYQRCGSFLIYGRLKPSATWTTIFSLLPPISLSPVIGGNELWGIPFSMWKSKDFRYTGLKTLEQWFNVFL